MWPDMCCLIEAVILNGESVYTDVFHICFVIDL
jgi:hypothetical protein